METKTKSFFHLEPFLSLSRFSYLGIDARYFTPQDVHVSVLALGATFFLAVDAEAAVAFLGTNAATFHGLAAGRVRQLSCDLDVQLQESLQGNVGRERLNTLRGINTRERVNSSPLFRSNNHDSPSKTETKEIPNGRDG